MVKVFLLCSGLGHVHRGYESFTRECYDALSSEKDLQITLFKGSGVASKGEVPLHCLKRRSSLAHFMAKWTKRDPYRLEQITFTLLLLPYLLLMRPQVVYFSDEKIGTHLYQWRRISPFKFRLLFSNGAPLGPPYPLWDHVQQVAPLYYETALAFGEPAQKQTLLPYGFEISASLESLSTDEKREQRRARGLPQDRLVLLSVGALNKHHKRIDYLIREVASLPGPRPFMVLLGQQEKDTNELKALAEECLGAGNYLIRSVPHEQVAGYYKTADFFVLASLNEGFGRVLVEAMSYGLPCLVHDYAVMRYVLSEQGHFGSFEQEGGLAAALSKVLDDPAQIDKEAIHRFAYERYSWAKIRPRYAEMLRQSVRIS